MNKYQLKSLLLIFLYSILSKYSIGQIPGPDPKPKELGKYKFKKSAIIVYNFNTGLQPDTIYQIHTNFKGDTVSFKTVDKLWFSKRVSFHLKINPYLYDVTIGTRQVNDEGLIDSSAFRLFSSSIITLSENKVAIDSAKKSKPPKDEPEAKPSESVTNILQDQVDAKKPDLEKITERLENYVDAEEIADSLNTNILLLKSFELNDQQVSKKLQKELRLIQKEKTAVEEFKSKQVDFYGALKSFYDAIDALQSIYDICEYSTLICLSDKKTNDEIIKEVADYIAKEQQGALNDFINLLPSTLFEYKKTMDRAYENTQSNYVALGSAYFTPRYFTISLKYDSTLNAFADSLYTRFNRIQPAIFSKTFSLIIRNLQNSKSFTHIAPTILIEKDSLIYTIETKPSGYFKPLIEAYGLKLYSSGKFDYRIPIKGNFKVNFSVGAAFMFNSLRGKDYFFSTALENLPNDSSEVTILEKNSGNSFLPAIAAYSHGYLKFGGWFTPAVTIGLSTNPTDFTNASYFAGLSLIYGQQNRLIFTFGRAGSSINILKPKYDLSKTYIKKDLLNIQESDLTKKAFKAGWFFGVSYNVSSNR